MADQKKIIGGLGKISKRLLRDRDEPLSKMDDVLSSKQAPMTTPSGTGLPLMPRDQGMYTLREQKDLPRMPKVDAARASGKSPKYTERMQDLLDSPTARKKVDKLINQGKDLNMTQWYGTEPLRQVAMDAGRTPEQFESLMAQLASASQRNPVDKQNQMGSYLYHLSQTGQLPENSLLLTNKLKKALKEDPSLAEGRTLVELPAGYGSLAQGDIFNRAVMIGQGDIAGALPPNKKLGTFYENLLGNLKPVTVDVNAVRGPIIERGDPRWLTSKLVEKDEEGRIINSYKPREMFDSGEMTMREAKQRPGFWEAAPSGSEYAGFEDLWQRGAKRHGVEPAEAQALGWYGSADVTALKTKPENYVDNLERLIKRTAEQTGQSPKKVMKDFVTGEGFLRKDGGAVDIDAADARLAAAMQARMAKGGEVSIKDSDARLQAAINARMGMAEGGEAGFKKLQFMAEGGSAFKTLQFQEPQRFDGGGIAVPEEGGGYSPKSFFDSKKWSDIKKNAAELYDEGKQTLASDYERLKSSPRARAQLAKIAAAQLAGGVPDLAHLAVDLVVDPLKSVTVDKLLTKPKPRSVMEDPLKPNEKQERVPMFGSLSEALKTEDGLPIGGSEHMIKRAQDAGLMHTGRFSPLTEIPAAILGGAGVAKAGKGVVKGYDKLTGANSGKLSSLQPEAMTAPAGKPQGATYATKQEGPFFRVSPTSLDVSGAKSRGLREADELQSQAPVGGSTGQAGSEVPLRISDEEVARLVANPETNQPLQIAQRFTKETQGTDFALPEIPESTLAKQSAIGRAHQLAVDGSPEYKSAVFDAYAKQMPDLLEQVGAKDYDDLMEKAYRQLAKETDEQFKQLPYNFSYHRAGEGDYLGGSKDMMADVHGNKHLYVFQGGDPHDFLNRVDKASGLNENEKFRAVHDLLGHAIYGNQFGPKGEEVAWAIHQQMYSPLARLAMTAETRGQNSLVNYSPLNVSLKSNIAKLEDLEVEALRRKDTALVNEIRAAKRQEFANNFQFAPQKAVLLPPEFIDPKFTGGMPDYLSAANRPAKGTETQSVLTHFSNDPNLQMLDPTKYGTGIKGKEAERLNDFLGGVKDRSYVYLGEPGTVSPESGLGVNRYRAESSNLYDITKDPLGFRPLARESNRTPFTAKYNAGITHPLQEANDYERLVKEYGYEGMINPNAGKPMGIMFKPTPVQPRKRGGLTQLK